MPSKLPCYSTHNLGVGGLVLNKDYTKFLSIKENIFGHLPTQKFPGGLVDQNETIFQAAVREVKEETNIDAVALGVLGFREILDFRFE